MPSPPPAPLPPPPAAREAGECKAYLRYVFRVEGNLAPPPLLKGGEGVRGREGTLGNSRKASMFARNGSGCPQWAMIINE